MKSAESISQHMLKSEVSDWQETFETNITAQFFMSAAFLPLLAKGRDVTPGYTSSIVNITSISGLMKGSSNGQFAYATSKAGFVHLTRMLATTLAETKIRVNQIAPGIFPSEMTTGESDETQKSELSSELSNPAGKSSAPFFRLPRPFQRGNLAQGKHADVIRTIGRGGGDADMAATILYLVGKGGLFLNNQLIHPEGGQLLVAPAAI